MANVNVLNLSRAQMTAVMLDTERVWLILGVCNKRLNMQIVDDYLIAKARELNLMNDAEWVQSAHEFIKATGKIFTEACHSIYTGS